MFPLSEHLAISRGNFAEKAMAPHSSTLAWKIPCAEEPGRLQSMGSQRVGHNWTTSLSLFTFMHWRRKWQWQPTPVFLPGEFQGRGSLMGCRLWGPPVSDTAEMTWQQQMQFWLSQSGPENCFQTQWVETRILLNAQDSHPNKELSETERHSLAHSIKHLSHTSHINILLVFYLT